MKQRSHKSFCSLWISVVIIGLLVLTVNSAGADSRCEMDDSRRQVCVPNTSLKIISLAPGSTELLFAAGAGQQVVAVDQHSDFPSAANHLPKVGGYPNINVEAIVAHKPDLVVIWSGGNARSVTRQLETLGLKTFHINAQDFAGIDRNIRQLGQIAGTAPVANQAADQFSQRLAELKARYQKQPELTVFFEIWRDPLMSVGGGQVITDAIRICGGRSLYADIAQPTVKVGIEQLIVADPDVILGSDPRGGTAESRREMMTFWKKWNSLTAVKKQQLFTVPSDSIARLTPRILDGTEIICKQLQAVREKSAGQKAPLKTADSA